MSKVECLNNLRSNYSEENHLVHVSHYKTPQQVCNDVYCFVEKRCLALTFWTIRVRVRLRRDDIEISKHTVHKSNSSVYRDTLEPNSIHDTV